MNQEARIRFLQGLVSLNEMRYSHGTISRADYLKKHAALLEEMEAAKRPASGFKIVCEDEDDGPYKFFVNGVEVGSADYDSHGGEGMRQAIKMFGNIAKQLGQEVAHVFEEDE